MPGPLRYVEPQDDLTKLKEVGFQTNQAVTIAHIAALARGNAEQYAAGLVRELRGEMLNLHGEAEQKRKYNPTLSTLLLAGAAGFTLGVWLCLLAK